MRIRTLFVILCLAGGLPGTTARAELAMAQDGSQILFAAAPGQTWTPSSGTETHLVLNPFGDSRGDGAPSLARNPFTAVFEVAWGRSGSSPAVMFASWDEGVQEWDVRTLASAVGSSSWAGRVVKLTHDSQGNRYVLYDDPESGKILLASAPRDSAHINRPIEVGEPGVLGSHPDYHWDGDHLVVAYTRRDGRGVEIVQIRPNWDLAGRIPNGGEGIPGIPEPIFSWSPVAAGPVIKPIPGAEQSLPPPMIQIEQLSDGRSLVTWVDRTRLMYTTREAGVWNEPDWLLVQDPVQHEAARESVRELLFGRIIRRPRGGESSGRTPIRRMR